ncbi:RNA-guided pseudouridylation complex pseudouridine synthase subunit Cbf5 [Candidatus Micrarchaeota archaeon]|nr:RNA-guided pseudouridylation complex pseudouridine synthase subunit Cbf5 [Candidatus Micrarchaeota archaeon]
MTKLTILQDESYSKGKKPSERSVKEKTRFGVVIVNKPCGPSSHEVSAFVKKILQVEKTGHTGTLDQDVSGVLPVLINDACKAVPFFIKERKQYVGVMHCEEEKSFAQIEKVFENFKGKIWQKPPLESAVAKKLRIREVYSLELLEVEGKNSLFKCDVEGGFYVRKLCTDAGELLGCGAKMAELRRTKAAGFAEKDAVTLQDLNDAKWLSDQRKNNSELEKIIHNLEDVTTLKKVIASDDVLKPITTGANLAIVGINALDKTIRKGEVVQVLTGKGELVCFATALMNGNTIIENKDGYGLAFDVLRVIQAF